MASMIIFPAFVVMLCISFFFFINHSQCLSQRPESDASFASRLIHRDSPLSPLHNPNATIRDRAKAALARSNARIRYFEARRRLGRDSLRSGLVPLMSASGEYLMSFTVGTPPVEMMAIADTGSELVWLQCLPCASCYNTRLRPLDPKQSKTYERLECVEYACRRLVGARCGADEIFCEYETFYVDGSRSSGDLAREAFGFDSNRGRKYNLTGIIFGCGHNNTGGEFEETGVVGLNKDPYSLLTQVFALSFSYCLTPVNETYGSFLMMGRDSMLSGVATPLVTVKNEEMFYYVNLLGISVGDVRLPIPADTFNITPEGQGGFMIDSGTRFTYLPDAAMDPLVAEMGKQVDNYCGRDVDPNEEFQLCYSSCPFADLQAPNIIFHFTNADVAVTKMGSFFQVSDEVLCLAMLPNENGVSLYGNHAQQGYNVGYDLLDSMVYFDPIDCTKVDF